MNLTKFSKTLRYRACVGESPAMAYQKVRWWAAGVMQSDYVLSEIVSQVQDYDWDDKPKIGLVSEILFYHIYHKEMDLVWALDCTDHTDFVSITNQWRIDVTTNLLKKRYELLDSGLSLPENLMFFEAWLPPEYFPEDKKMTRAKVLKENSNNLEDCIRFRGISATSLKSQHVLNKLVLPNPPHWDRDAGTSLIKSELLMHLKEQYSDKWDNFCTVEESALEYLEEIEDKLYDFVSENISKKTILPEDVAVYADSLFKSKYEESGHLQNLFSRLSGLPS